MPSLVGSEMCIRDRARALQQLSPAVPGRLVRKNEDAEGAPLRCWMRASSPEKESELRTVYVLIVACFTAVGHASIELVFLRKAMVAPRVGHVFRPGLPGSCRALLLRATRKPS